jgi:hypothetical protein
MENDIRVLNKKYLRGPAGNAVYVGRPSVWGNPFVIGKDGSRAECNRKIRSVAYVAATALVEASRAARQESCLLVRAAGLSCRRAAAACE